MKKALLITVGTGPTVSDGIAYAIRQQHPDFVLFMGTRRSLDLTLPSVLAATEYQEYCHETRETTDLNDVEKIALEYSGYIEELQSKGYAPEGMVTDFTSGTKAMSAGLVVAAVSREVGTISYVYGDRNEAGQVISGTERLMPAEPHQLLAEAQIRRAVELFNQYQYNSCLMFVDAVEARTKKPDVMERASLLRGLAEGYAAWDRFDHRASMSTLDSLTGHRLLPTWGLKKSLERHKQFLHFVIDEPYSTVRAVDLLGNAERRAEEGKFDDAVARLYRLLEYVAQVRLYTNYGLNTEDVKEDMIPEPVRPNYEAFRERTGKIQLGLVASYNLLADLGEDVGKRFVEDHQKKKSALKAALGMRNNSILAHGFTPVGQEGYAKLIALARRYLDLVDPRWESRISCAKFPNIRM